MEVQHRAIRASRCDYRAKRKRADEVIKLLRDKLLPLSVVPGVGRTCSVGGDSENLPVRRVVPEERWYRVAVF